MCGTELLVGTLISKYFVNLTSVLVVYNTSSLSEINQHYVDATKATFQNLSRQGVPIGVHWINVAVLKEQLDFNELLLQHVDMGIQGFITILSSVAGFLNARWYATEKSLLRLKDKYYLFLSEDESPKDVLAEEILKLYPHHLLVSARKYPDLELWTQKFAGAEEDNFSAVHLDTYYANGNFARNVELYPNKLLNMLGRTLATASITYIPYLVSYFVPEGTGDVDCIDPNQPERNIIYTGTEADILKSFCELRNCTIRVIPYGKDNWGAIFANGTSNGMIGSVYRNEAEFGIGCYYNWYNDIFETSIAIAKSAVTIIAPGPSRYPAYMTNILPFTKAIWTMILFTIVISSFAMHGIRIFSNRIDHLGRDNIPDIEHCSLYQLTLLEIVALFFQQPFAQHRLDRFASRLFLSGLLLAGITLEYTYSGQLKSLLTIPLFTDPVDTINKFALTSWKWGAPAPAWVLTISDSDIPFEKVMKDKFEILSYGELRNATYGGNYGLAVERLHGGTFSFGDYIRDGGLNQMILSKDDLFFDWTRAFSVRGWPLMEEFNTHVLWCFEHGLYKYWEHTYVSKFLDKKTQQTFLSLASEHSFPKETVPISDISGPLLALAFGYSFALLAFLIEICVDFIKKWLIK